MENASFLLAINLAVAGMFAGALFCIAALDAKRSAARWFALSFLAAMSYFLVELVAATFGSDYVLYLPGFTAFFISLLLTNVALARHYDVAVPWKAMAVLAVAGMAMAIASRHLPYYSLTSLILYQAPYMLAQLLGAMIILPNCKRRPLDVILGLFFLFSAMHFLAKPFIAVATGANENLYRYVDKSYALFSQSIGTVLGTAIALLVIIIMMRHILAQMTEQARTDALSGLLNRGGFQEKLVETLSSDKRARGPSSLIVCDLDHFKSINDSYGHACGDRVIKAFASIMQDVSSNTAVLGRIGGEEFGFFLPNCPMVGAQRVAENARQAFHALEIDGIGLDHGLSASFGVVQIEAGEDALEAMCRADQAMYLAKSSGRNCVTTGGEVPKMALASLPRFPVSMAI